MLSFVNLSMSRQALKGFLEASWHALAVWVGVQYGFLVDHGFTFFGFWRAPVRTD